MGGVYFPKVRGNRESYRRRHSQRGGHLEHQVGLVHVAGEQEGAGPRAGLGRNLQGLAAIKTIVNDSIVNESILERRRKLAGYGSDSRMRFFATGSTSKEIAYRFPASAPRTLASAS